MSSRDLHEILSGYACLNLPQVNSLGGAGGFSGASFWRVVSGEAIYCLRRWPREHPSPRRLAQIHRVLRHAADNGVDFVPAPLLTYSGESFVSLTGRLWELTRWLPGQANYAIQPNQQKLSAALQSLARFHLAAASLDVPRPPARSRGLSERHERLRELLGGGMVRIEQALDASARRRSLRLEPRIVELFHQNAPWVERQLAAEKLRQVNQQPCIRDIWHDHILFTGDEVTGIVDFGALRTDTVSGDIARLLGSLAKDEPGIWTAGIAAYESIRPLSEVERRFVSTFDQTSVLMSGISWLEWIYVDQRKFEDIDRIQQRLTETLARMEHLNIVRRESRLELP